MKKSNSNAKEIKTIEISFGMFRLHEAGQSLSIKGRLIADPATSFEVGVFGEAFVSIMPVVSAMAKSGDFKPLQFDNSALVWFKPNTPCKIHAVGVYGVDKKGKRIFPKLNCNDSSSVEIETLITHAEVQDLQNSLASLMPSLKTQHINTPETGAGNIDPKKIKSSQAAS